METVDIIHDYKEQKVEPFWWIFYFCSISVAFLVSIAFIVVPPLLLFFIPSIWLLFLFLLIPAGIWMTRKLYQHTRKLIWHNNHLSSYFLSEDTVFTSEWKDAFQHEPVERTIALADVQFVVASSYIVRETRSSRRHGGSGSTITETAPILYINYKDNEQRNILSIPLPAEGYEMNTWLTYFQDRSCPLKYTASVLYRADMPFLTDEQRLDYLASANDMMDFSFTGDWQLQARELWAKWMEKAVEREKEEEAKNPELKKARQKPSFQKWANITLFVYALIIGASFLAIELARRALIPADNFVPGLLIFLLGGFVYFYLFRSYLPWYYMLLFSGKALIFGFIISISFDDGNERAAEMATSIGAFSILFPTIVWIPFLLVKWLINDRKRNA